LRFPTQAAAIFAARALPASLPAQPAAMALIPIVVPDVARARNPAADHPTRATFEIEDMLRTTVDAATAAVAGLQSGHVVPSPRDTQPEHADRMARMVALTIFGR